MDVQSSVLWSLTRTRDSLLKALEGLTPTRVAWRACGNCNSIGSMVIHLGRVEDGWTHRVTGGKDIWETEGWCNKLELPTNDRGWTFDKQTLQQQRPLNDLVAYYEATHRLLVETVQKTSASRLDETPENPMKLMVGQVFAHLIIEENQHVGQIAYLKGMQENLGIK